jgi:hypothetical protein
MQIFIGPLIAAYYYRLYMNLKAIKPEAASAALSGPKGLFIFSALLGVLFIIAAIIFIFLVIFFTGI